MVSEHGEHSDYVLNMKANPQVRVRIGGKWRNGIANLLPDDDPVRRLGNYPGSTARWCADGQRPADHSDRPRLMAYDEDLAHRIRELLGNERGVLHAQTCEGVYHGQQIKHDTNRSRLASSFAPGGDAKN